MTTTIATASKLHRLGRLLAPTAIAVVLVGFANTTARAATRYHYDRTIRTCMSQG
jgi:hypothetical protein